MREPLRIVTKDFIFGTVAQSRQGINPVKDVVDFLGQTLCVTAPTEALETLAQSLSDGGGQGLTRFLGALSCYKTDWNIDSIRSRGLFVAKLKWLGYEVSSPMTSLSLVINLMARFNDRAKWLPLLLPGCVFLWDFAVLQWVFAHEPGITARVVFYFDLALLPGTLLFFPMPAMLFNCSLACLIGLVVWVVRRERPKQSRA